MGKRIDFQPLERIPETRLRYVEEAPKIDPKRRRARFICDCGNEVETDLNWVRFKNVTSCGCYKSELVVQKNTKHSHASRAVKSGAYRSWQAMHQRASTHPLYKDRPVCPRWCGEDGFANFYSDMGDRPEGLTIDRIDNAGIYEPSNCRWATRQEQALNH